VKRYWHSLASAAVLATAACASGGIRAEAQAPPPQGQDPMLPPPGLGSLRQDQVGVRMQTTELAVRVIPLDERVIRLLSPDAYQSLQQMRQSRLDAIGAAAHSAGYDSVAAFMVTFFGLQPQVRFNPDQLSIASQNVTYRPIGIVPITPRWSDGVLEQRQQQAAIYLYDPAVQVLRPFTVFYGPQSSDAWNDVLRVLNNERARVLSRAQQPARP
jgi:hypothetical protein